MAKGGVRIRDKDRGMKRIRSVLRQAQMRRKVVVVGWLDDGKGGEDHDAADGLTVAQLAAVHEYGAEIETTNGTIVIPARAPLRTTMDEQRDANVKKLRVLATAVLEGRIELDKALNIFGVDMVGQVVKRIRVGLPPPNAPSTIARKGSSKPLIDTAQLVQSVQHIVREREA
jgi:hypothetical protein